MTDIKLYEVVKATKLYEIDDINSVGFPRHKGKGKQIIIKVGSILQSTGRTKRAKIFTNEKPTFLILTNGDGVRLEDVKLKEAVVVTESVEEKQLVNEFSSSNNQSEVKENDISQTQNVKEMNENQTAQTVQETPLQAEVIVNRPDPVLSKDDIKQNRIGYKKFDNTQIIGALIGATLFGLVTWKVTKNKWKTVAAVIGGIIIGGAIGRVLGRTGTKKIAEVNDVQQTIAKVEINPQTEVSPPEKEAISKPSEPQQYYQVGQTYSFKTPQLIQPMAFLNGVLYMASKSDGSPARIEPNTKVTGKLVEITEPVLFLANPQSKKIEQSKINIPLPFIEIKDGIYVPLALLSHDGAVLMDELGAWMENQPEGKVLENEVYVKGRYAGRRSYYLMYLPTHSANIANEFRINKTP